MTSFYDTEEASVIPCTVVEATPSTVSQIRTMEKDGYVAIQVAYGQSKAKNTSAALQGHLKKSGLESASVLKEFKNPEGAFKLGQQLTADSVFEVGDFVDVVGTSKGKGFQGVVKRYNFGGVGGQTHGQHNRQRHPGSNGACSFPSRVFKGKRHAGRMGGNRVKVQNLKVVKLFPEKNLILISGSLPGSNNSIVYLEK